MLSQADLLGMQAAVTATLGQLAAVYRTVQTTDRYGGQSEVETLAAENVPCRLAPAGGTAGERLIAGRPESRGAWAVTFAAETDVRLRDRLRIGGRSLRVDVVLGPRASEVCRRALCSEVV